jgi:hypothetical protein
MRKLGLLAAVIVVFILSQPILAAADITQSIRSALPVTALPVEATQPRASQPMLTQASPPAAPGSGDTLESSCVSDVSASIHADAVAPYLRSLNPDSSEPIRTLEELLAQLDPNFACGTYIQVGKDGYPRIVRVYRSTVGNLNASGLDTTIASHMASIPLSGYSSIIVVGTTTTNARLAVVKTSTSSTTDVVRDLPPSDADQLVRFAARGETLLLSARSNSRDRLNCSDFSSGASAQAFFFSHPGDPNRLDADNDGIACERFEHRTYSWESHRPLVRPPVTTPRVAPAPAPTVRTSPGRCWVNGYTRKNGTRVSGYYRSC